MKNNPGAAFERELITTCDAYERAGLARIKKVEPPTRMARKGGRWTPFFLANPFLDFIGTFGGRACVLEAKTTQKPRLSVASGGGGITEAQLAAAEAWAAAGAVVAILWKWENEVRITTPAFLAVRAGASIRWEDAFDVPRGEGFVLWDFLPALRALGS